LLQPLHCAAVSPGSSKQTTGITDSTDGRTINAGPVVLNVLALMQLPRLWTGNRPGLERSAAIRC
jgi:hypothetical protein